MRDLTAQHHFVMEVELNDMGAVTVAQMRDQTPNRPTIARECGINIFSGHRNVAVCESAGHTEPLTRSEIVPLLWVLYQTSQGLNNERVTPVAYVLQKWVHRGAMSNSDEGPQGDGEEITAERGYDGTKLAVMLDDVDVSMGPATIIGALQHGGRIIRADSVGMLVVESPGWRDGHARA